MYRGVPVVHVCAMHPVAAAFSRCTRCGAFACVPCTLFDELRPVCQRCVLRLRDEARFTRKVFVALALSFLGALAI